MGIYQQYRQWKPSAKGKNQEKTTLKSLQNQQEYLTAAAKSLKTPILKNNASTQRSEMEVTILEGIGKKHPGRKLN